MSLPIADEAEVLARNRAFYAAFRERDLSLMDDVWARRVPVACVHPGWQAIRGRPQVMASFRAILGNLGAPSIDCEGETVHIQGESAFVVCEEVLEGGRLVATNIFIREEGEWRMCLHQAGPMARPSAHDGDAESETDDDATLEATDEDGESETEVEDIDDLSQKFSISTLRTQRRLLN